METLIILNTVLLLIVLAFIVFVLRDMLKNTPEQFGVMKAITPKPKAEVFSRDDETLWEEEQAKGERGKG